MTEVYMSPKDSISLILDSDKTDFMTSYSPPIELKKDKQYEVALVNLETYYSFPNIDKTNNIFRYSIDKGAKWIEIEIPEGSYELKQINNEIFRIMKSRDHYDKRMNKSYINISANLATLRCILQINNLDYQVDFSHKRSLSDLLGYEKKKISTPYNEGTNTVNILSVNSILVECNIINSSYLNSVKEPIIYSFFPKCLPGEKIIETPKNLIYLPLNNNDKIDYINIKLKDNNGKLLNLRGEKITIRLHLKEA
jgi:hypothetical protein